MCIDATEFDRRIAFEDLPTAGAFTVFDASRDMFEVARNYAQFFAHESCGFCTPCRVGTSMLVAAMDKIDAGNGTQHELREMNRLNRVLLMSAHCGLGHTACNPILDTLKRFRPAYERKLRSLDFTPAFDLDGALDRARQMTGRDDAGAHLETAAVNERPTLPARRRRGAVRARPDRDAGRARRRPLHPAPVLPPGVHAARQLQGVHGEGQRPDDGRVHHARRESATEVESNTEELNELRRTLVQMLFAEGNHFCPSCEKSGNCVLQALGYDLGVMTAGFRHLFPDRPVDASHPEILLDFNRCILCELCVRAAREVDGKHVFSLAGRGLGKHLIVNAESGRLADTDVDGHRQGRRGLPGRRDPAQARRLRDADRRAPLRRLADQRAGARRRAAPAGETP